MRLNPQKNAFVPIIHTGLKQRGSGDGKRESNTSEVNGWEKGQWKNGEKLKIATGIKSEKILSPPTGHNNTEMRQKTGSDNFRNSEVQCSTQWQNSPVRECNDVLNHDS